MASVDSRWSARMSPKVHMIVRLDLCLKGKGGCQYLQCEEPLLVEASLKAHIQHTQARHQLQLDWVEDLPLCSGVPMCSAGVTRTLGEFKSSKPINVRTLGFK